MDPQVRAKLFPAVAAKAKESQPKQTVGLKGSCGNSWFRQKIKHLILVSFELPVFTIGLRADAANGVVGSVDLSFAEFLFSYERCNGYETSIQVKRYFAFFFCWEYQCLFLGLAAFGDNGRSAPTGENKTANHGGFIGRGRAPEQFRFSFDIMPQYPRVSTVQELLERLVARPPGD